MAASGVGEIAILADGKSALYPYLWGTQGTFLYTRAMTSIVLYHLDHHKIVDRRQQLYQTIKRQLTQAEEKLRRLRKHADMTAQQALAEDVRALKEFMAPEQPYSATARCALMALRGLYPVAELVLHGS